MSIFSKKIRKPDASINMGDYNPGDIDPTTGREMIYICYQTPLFLVSIDSEYSLNWFCANGITYAPDFGEITSKVNLTDALVDRIFVGKKNKFAYKKILGDVLSTLLDDEDSKTARLMMDEVKERIEMHCKERIRMAYINSAILAVIITGLLVIGTLIFRSQILQQVRQVDIFRIIVCTLLGGVGAFVTTFARFKDYQGSFIAGLPIHRLDGFLRVFYGLVAGIIISLAIKSKMLAGFAADGTEPWLLYFFAMIAGASEVLIPNLVKQAEDKTVFKETNTQQATGNPQTTNSQTTVNPQATANPQTANSQTTVTTATNNATPEKETPAVPVAASTVDTDHKSVTTTSTSDAATTLVVPESTTSASSINEETSDAGSDVLP